MKNERSVYWLGVLTGALCAVLLLILGMDLGLVPLFFGRGVLGDAKTVKKLAALENLIDTYYLEEINDEDLKDGLYYGLVAGLRDPYSRYYTPREYLEESKDNAGSYVGIGVVVQKTEEGILITQCYEGGNAQQAGVLTGDVIVAINGESIVDLSIEEVVEQISGKGNTEVVLTLKRAGSAQLLKQTVPVSEVEVPTVTGKLLDADTGYLKIREFSSITPGQFRETFLGLKQEGMKQLIVDLRNNPGGMLDASCEILNEILPEGLIVYTEDKNGNRQEHRSEGLTSLDIPLAVLVNQNTASAAEIFAGAVQDHGIGTIVGETTYGKGIVQTLFSMKDGSAVKLTVSNYYTPKGKNIHNKGITPDVEAALEEGEEPDTKAPYDTQIRAAQKLFESDGAAG